jgi:hypothetical protein
VNCTTCQGQMQKHYLDVVFILLCPTCGTATWGDDCAVYVPAQAKSHAALRKACEAFVKAFTVDSQWHKMEWAIDQAKAALALDAKNERT